MDLLPHLMECCRLGPVDIDIHFYPPVSASAFASRKELAAYCEKVVGAGVCHTLAGREGLADTDGFLPQTAPSMAVSDAKAMA